MVAIYSFDTQSYRPLADELSAKSLWSTWLNDSRRLLISTQHDNNGFLHLLDTESGEYQEILSSSDLSKASGPITGMPSLTADNQKIYVSRLQRQNEIWMLTLGDQE